MIEQDLLKFTFVSLLSETAYHRIELYQQETTGLWKNITILDEKVKQAVMPLLSNWNVHVCFCCNEVHLLFPTQKEQPLCVLRKQLHDFDEMVSLLQRLFLTITIEKPPKELIHLLCDQKNLALQENGEWNLYASPQLERLTRNKHKEDACCWQKMCVQLLEEQRMDQYEKKPIPESYTTVLHQLKDEQPLSFHELIALLGEIKGCFQDEPPPQNKLKKLLHICSGALLIIMVILSILFFAYEYVKQRQAYFPELDTIGDVKVNP